ncbi:MAG: cell division protein FtsA [Armatimonadetes bacterium]|nr:cell division protein FtsA [Armatimonadota bacterium]NIM24716.1 cell division protein FtsA [Armatimonadota bacterium]NIM68596.1 cell division protein FtsA [Armatimonadota bacterium]NIM77113.1 cell division protein FtsA [Armatimonadota bacterium]NIN06790.1 cell division protein FtsA [Armatimonadota bacterium]
MFKLSVDDIVSNGNLILGIDLGTNKVAALLGRLDGGKLSLDRVGLAPSQGLRRGEIVDLEKAASSISQAIDGLNARRPKGIATSVDRSVAVPRIPHRAWVGITGDHVRCFNPRADIPISRPGRAVSPRDVEQVMRAAVGSLELPSGHEVVHVIARSFAVDTSGNSSPKSAKDASIEHTPIFCNSIANPVGMAARRLEVQAHVVTASTTSLGHLERCMEEAGLGVEGVVLEPLASADAVLSEAERDLGTVLLDIGAGTTDMAILVDGSVCCTAAVPIGGRHITRDLAVGLEIDVEEAEALKIAKGCALVDMVGANEKVTVNILSAEGPRQIPRRLLAQIIQPRAAEMVSLVKDQMVRSGYFHRLSIGAVLTGGGSQLEGILPLAKQIFGLPVRLGRPSARGPANLKDPRLSTSVGLLLYGSQEQVHSTPVSAWSRAKPNLGTRVLGWWKHLFGP